MNKTFDDDSAVSPVIGILLMVVVTLIIAAIVSGFSGSFVSGQQKVPNAQISGVFSVSSGFTITHKGGDSIAIKDMIITVKNSRIWGPDVEERSLSVVNKTNLTDSTGSNHWLYSDGSSDITSFKAGDTAHINITGCDCRWFQESIAPRPKNIGEGYFDSDGNYVGTTKAAFWALCFRNKDNIGKTFIMEISDAGTGKLISIANVPITP